MDPIVRDFEFIAGDLVGDPDRGFWTLASASIGGVAVRDFAILPNGNTVFVPLHGEGTDLLVVIISPSGEIINSKKYTFNQTVSAYGISIVNGLIVISGSFFVPAGNNYWFMKLNFDLTVGYSGYWPVGAGDNTLTQCAAAGTDLIFGGWYSGGVSNYPILLSTNSVGSLIFGRYTPSIPTDGYVWDIKTIPGEEAIIYISSKNIMKVNKGAVVVWNVVLGDAQHYSNIYVTESYVFFTYGLTSTQTGIIQLKVSDGTLVSKFFTESVDFQKLDGYGNSIFVSGANFNNTKINVSKFTFEPLSNPDTSTHALNHSFSRLITISEFGYNVPEIKVSDDSIYLFSNKNSSDINLIKLPKNGSILGSYLSAFGSGINISSLSIVEKTSSVTLSPSAASMSQLSASGLGATIVTPATPATLPTLTKRTF